MKITAEFNSNEELLSFIGTFGNKTFKAEQGCSNTTNIVNKVAEKKIGAVIEDKKEKVTPVVEAEIVSQKTPKGEVVDAESTSVEQDPRKAANNDKKDEGPKITKEQVRAVFTKLIKAGKQKEAKALTEKYGASKLPEVKEEDYAAIYKEAEGLI